jgi:hypothetical protein
MNPYNTKDNKSHTQNKKQKPIKDPPTHNSKTQSKPKTNLLDP